MTGSCDHGNEASDFIKGEEFLHENRVLRRIFGSKMGKHEADRQNYAIISYLVLFAKYFFCFWIVYRRCQQFKLHAYSVKLHND
jgi:hypothetical protein